MNRFSVTIVILTLALADGRASSEQGTNPMQNIQVSAPITVEQAGKSGAVAASSVVRVVCQATSMGGSGFLHRSGRVVTAAHVVAACQATQLVLITSAGNRVQVSSLSVDTDRDLALLQPSVGIAGPSLPISNRTEIPVGAQVSTWGFPAGYSGVVPLLTVGFLAGIDRIQTATGASSPRWVVNAAFNGGNSGGPVLTVDDGAVVGVVSSKLAPIPPLIESALEALENQKSGFVYTKTMPDGTKVSVSEGQVVGEVLKYLRSQTQLVLGHAVTSEDLRTFLKTHKIDP